MPTAILGARGIGNIETDARPKSWLGIAWLSEAREMSFAVLTSLMKSEPVEDIEYNWFEQDIEAFEILSNGGAGPGAQSLIFDDGSGGGVSNNLRNGSLIKNDRTEEIVLVTVDPTSNSAAVTVTRGYGTVTAQTINDDDRWTILGFADEDDQTSPTPISTNAVTKTNFTQLMREPIKIGALAASVSNFRTGREYARRRKQAFLQFLRRWERQFIHGQPKSAPGASSENLRTQTGGILNPISTNVKNFGGSVSESSYDTEVEKWFRYGSRAKIAVTGGVAAVTVNKMAKFSGGTIYLMPGDQTYGLRIHEYQHVAGSIQMLYTPAIGISTNYASWQIIIDTMQLSRAVMPGFDFQLRKDVQENGVLGVKDELIMDCGIKLGLEKHHAISKNMDIFVA